MKHLIPLTLLLLTSCSHLPENAYIRNAKINTPWGSTSIEAAATGKAAENLTQTERAELLAPKVRVNR